VTAQIAGISSQFMQHENTPGESSATVEPSTSLPLLRRPRALVFGVFFGVFALITALIAPLAQLWRAGMTPLDAQARLWPRVPLVGQPARVVVTLPAESARAAGSWTATLTFTALGSDQAAKTPAPNGLAWCAEAPARAVGSPGGTY
jgi:hypothetical protein